MPAPDISDYFRRLDAHLAGLRDDEARRRCLNNLSKRFTRERAEFITAVERNRTVVEGPSSWDYFLTIAEIDQRLGALRREAA